MQQDPSLQDLPYKIELNAWGKVEMSPASIRHGRLQAALTVELAQQLPDGVTVTECPILTDIGIRVPDLAWASAQFMSQHERDVAAPACAGDLRRGPFPFERIGRNNGKDARLSRRRGAGSVAGLGGRKHSLRRSLRRKGTQCLPRYRKASRPDEGLPMKRENVVGRANVEDTPELEAYYREPRRRGAGRAVERGERDRALVPAAQIGADALEVEDASSLSCDARRSWCRPRRRRGAW